MALSILLSAAFFFHLQNCHFVLKKTTMKLFESFPEIIESHISLTDFREIFTETFPHLVLLTVAFFCDSGLAREEFLKVVCTDAIVPTLDFQLEKVIEHLSVGEVINIASKR